MSGKLDGKVIIVAGGGAIGSALAHRYAQEGARIVVGDLNEEHAKSLATEIDPSGDRAAGIHLDGADDASVKAMVALTLEKFGRLDGLHANFASFADGTNKYDVVSLPLEAYDEVMDVNARGFMLCTRHAVPAMIASGGGSIVYTSSINAYQAIPVRLTYSMSKLAIHALMRHTAHRFGPDRIRANVITPGLIMHQALEGKLPQSFFEESRAKNLLKHRFGAPEDVAALGAFLLSDDAGYITAQVIAVDGGAFIRP